MGCISGNKSMKKNTVLILENGSLFFGETVDQKPSGQGIRYSSNGDVLVGWWVSGVLKQSRSIILKGVYAEQRGLTYLPNNLQHLGQIEVLNLSFNQIYQLPESICSLSKMKKLFLKSNCLRQLPFNIGLLVSLEELEMSENSIMSLPSSFAHLASLQYLDIDEHLMPDEGIFSNQPFSRLNHLNSINIYWRNRNQVKATKIMNEGEDRQIQVTFENFNESEQPQY